MAVWSNETLHNASWNIESANSASWASQDKHTNFSKLLLENGSFGLLESGSYILLDFSTDDLNWVNQTKN